MTIDDEMPQQLSFIHALTKHLLNVPESRASEIFIAVHPCGPRGDKWLVKVIHERMDVISTAADKLSEALSTLVELLTEQVAKKLEEGTKLLKTET